MPALHPQPERWAVDAYKIAAFFMPQRQQPFAVDAPSPERPTVSLYSSNTSVTEQGDHSKRTNLSSPLEAPPAQGRGDDAPRANADGSQPPALNPAPLPLIESLCQKLDDAAVVYCHWKSNAAIDRSANGLNDLDLLIRRQDSVRFAEIMAQYGFKLVLDQGEAALPGVSSYYGFVKESGQLIHVHAHYQLVLGQDRTKNYRLPVEDALLASRAKTGIFYTCSPEYEFVIFVIRMVLKYGTWDAWLGRQSRLPKSSRNELTWLLERIEWTRVHAIIDRDFPTLSTTLFDRCAKAVQGKSPLWERIACGNKLMKALEAYTRHSGGADLFRKGWQRIKNGYQRRRYGQTDKARLATGGTMIAIVGGDGAGKSTAIDGLYHWLAKELAVQCIHLGKPPRSLATNIVRNLIGLVHLPNKLLARKERKHAGTKLNTSTEFPGYLPLFLLLCTSRDRYWAYVRARRIVNNGGIVISDRFPLPDFVRMDGPQIEYLVTNRAQGPLLRMMIARERAYYRAMSHPEVLAVLRLHPAIAVERKQDEVSSFVHLRSAEIWDAQWDSPTITVVDAEQPQETVLAELKELVWARL